MIKLPNYHIAKKIYTGTRTTVYRGLNTTNQQPVVIKVINKEYPTFSELLQFRHQYTITRNLNLSGIVKPISLEKYGNGYALIMEDIGAISLKKYLSNQQLNLPNFLELAISIVKILEDLYHHQIIHKDIKPSNIVINPDTGDIKLIDFSISTLLPRETQEIINPNVLQGTLAYMSPEQTGRMNRGIDYRSDFYSLGITFYEILTNQLPFISNDPIELVYFHIAKEPTPPTELNTEIPETINNIIRKMMAKNAEERYQNAFGLKHDLETCLNSWQAIGNIPIFELGKRDISDRFTIPEKLYGRQEEVENLLDAFERVAQGESEIMLVAGFSGIGKTAVINEVHKPIVRQRGYFIKGKFDQFQRNIPFSALVQAFRDLMGELLSETANQLEEWKTKILAALGVQGQVIIDVIPELELIIYPQPAVEELSGSAGENRFNLLFLKFIKVFTTKEHPLVIFLDDLQWADTASLKLMQLLMSEKNSQHLLLLGAYRDNEVNPTHPLILTLEEIVKNSAIVNTITLKPLALSSDVNPLVADTLHCSEEIAFPLAELVYQKTKGNPFFLTQFLKALYKEELITFNYEVNYWECDIAKVKLLSLTDDVVEFMATRLQKLSSSTQEVMKLAACIGNKFNLETLGIVSEKSLGETANNLWEALQEGLVLPVTEMYKFYISEESNLTDFPGIKTDANYRFLHDRVQQAAYLLIPKAEKQITHLKIGRLLLENIPESERQERIFDIVNQLNYGVNLISDSREREQLAELNLMAGKKAKVSTAYMAAINYFTFGLELLPENSWQIKYNLTLDIYVEMIEAEYLTTNFERSVDLAEIVLQKTKNIIDKVKVYELKIQIYVAKLELNTAIEVGLQVLEIMEISLVESCPPIEVIENLANLPEMTDQNKLGAMRILVALISPVYFLNSPLLSQIIFTMISLSLQYGNSTYSAYGYVLNGLFLCGIMSEFESGYCYGKLALNLLEKFNTKELKSRILMVFNGNVRHWREHYRVTCKPLVEAIEVGLSTGDIEYASYAVYDYINAVLAMGENLESLSKKQSNYVQLMQNLKQEHSTNCVKIQWQTVLNLLDKSENSFQLIGTAFDETKMLPIFRDSKNAILLFYTYLYKGKLLYLFQHSEEAIQAFSMAEKYIDSVAGMLIVAQHNFYYSLALLEFVRLKSWQNQNNNNSWLKKVEINQKKMEIWAHHAPMNYLHKFYLVEAEKHRVLHNYLQAIEFYEQAIAIATENEYIHEVAIANELAAKFYLEWNKETIAQAYLIKAYYAYAQWGAVAKLKYLEKCYGDILKPLQQESNLTSSLTTDTVTYTSSNTSLVLDFSSLIKVTQAISGEIKLENLLSVLMRATLENAGAEKGYLILPQGENWVIEAEAIRNSNLGEELQLISKHSLPLESTNKLPNSLIYYVARTQQTVVLDDAANEAKFAADSYIQNYQPKSILCIPIINLSQFIGILYLENNLTAGAFTRERLEILKVLTTQAAFSLENARLYQESQNYAQQLEETQLQLVQNEKMASIGQLTTGVAHEINNPVGFISGNLAHASDYIQNMINLLNLYRQTFPQPGVKILEEMEAMELDYLMEDLPNMIDSMKEGIERITEISKSMRTFSRGDQTSKISFNIQDGINSTLLILKHRLKANNNRPEIQIVKNYGNLPTISCYPGQLNQVFMNLIANAIDALEESNMGKTFTEIKTAPNQIAITTEIDQEKQQAIIKIRDNGMGMSEEVKKKVFGHLFTTKPVGKGTGLGLSISQQIVEEKHGGKISCISELGKGTEFIISLPINV
ncbi:AAA family ATPase [Okeania sp.]|uniref:trifunctional serine/threonine-protein kinase/ATP-binding protein/sensor histidine kinase n=1 Tax=Okeania sp. TaxID=3100323 RepID=UPI002B4B8090|nr:AAA family ATPase [Okeania sp.]MEB3341566.1 AAA family ATPase [Okeania sp.]